MMRIQKRYGSVSGMPPSVTLDVSYRDLARVPSTRMHASLENSSDVPLAVRCRRYRGVSSGSRIQPHNDSMWGNVVSIEVGLRFYMNPRRLWMSVEVSQAPCPDQGPEARADNVYKWNT